MYLTFVTCSLDQREFACHQCYRRYKSKGILIRHLKYECGKEATFFCSQPGCIYKAKRFWTLKRHARIKNHPINWYRMEENMEEDNKMY